MQLARDGLGGAARLGVAARRREHEHLAGGVGGHVVDRGDRARGGGAGGALGGGEHAHAPVVLGRGVVVRADHDDRRAAVERHAQLGSAGDDVAAVGDLAVEHRAQERLLSGFGRPLGRAQALDLRGDQGGDEPQQRGRRLAGAAAQAQPTDDRVTDPELVRAHARHVGHQGALVGRGARRDGQHRAGAVDQDERGVERARGRAHDLGEAAAGLDRVGDRSERIEIERRLGFHSPDSRRAVLPAGS